MEVLYLLFAVSVIFIYFFRRDLKEKFVPNKGKYYTIDDQYNAERRNREIEIDSLLAKMGKNGVNDLSEKDRKRLEELSKK
ncbi:MAG: rhomboid family protein [Flavobacteriia bacterium]|nr:rhomboid family protein [Flavobacteriia bacterium]MBH2024180.1 rhomboid family protein [Flavobacteriales bacterium]